MLLESLNFASRFEYGPVQRTLIDLVISKITAITTLNPLIKRSGN